MNKFIVLSLGLAVCVSLSGCTKADELAKPSAQVAMSNLQTALAEGKAAKCGTITNVSGVTSESQMYIDTKGARTRTITKVSIAGTTQISNGLKLKDKVYTWVEGSKEGFVLSTSELKDIPTVKDAPAQAPSVVNQDLQADLDKLSQQVNTTCEAWKIDEVMFKLPKDIKFADQMAKLKEMTDNANAALKASEAKRKK